MSRASSVAGSEPPDHSSGSPGGPGATYESAGVDIEAAYAAELDVEEHGHKLVEQQRVDRHEHQAVE